MKLEGKKVVFEKIQGPPPKKDTPETEVKELPATPEAKLTKEQEVE